MFNFFLLIGLVSASVAFDGHIIRKRFTWHEESNLYWAENCDWAGNEYGSVKVPGEQCGGECAKKSGCTHFTWTKFNGGTCWMKNNAATIDQAKSKTDEYSVCGMMKQSLQQIKNDIKSGRIPIRGVNLGGWLVAEHWMTADSPAWKGVPDNIANQGEYQTMKFLGHAKGDAQFAQHRDTYITEQDFKDIAAAKLSTVRIPVGYWIVGFDNSGGGDPDGWKMFAPGALAYLDKAIREWAPRNKLLVLISMHAAKGSQNGNDHSAAADPGHAYWSGYPENVKNTLDVVEWLAKRYKDDVSFLGIGLLNEPKDDQNEGVLKQYYYDAYGRIRQFSDCLLTISPKLSQQGPNDSDWNKFMPPPNWQNVRHEWHRYQVWGFESYDENRLISYANNELTNAIKSWTGNWLFIGEWCIASSAAFKSDDQLRQYAQAQLKAFSQAKGGWTYWSWKFYNDDGSTRNAWSMKAMIKKGLLQIQ